MQHCFAIHNVLPGEWIVHFVEPARLPIHLPLTLLPNPGETSFVSRMEASQRSSTAALFPDLDLSSHQITLNGGGDGFSPVRSDGITIGVHTDQLDLASESFSFTTEDLAVSMHPYAARERARWQ